MTTIHSTNDLPMGICVLVDGGCLNNNRPVTERKMYGSMTVFCDRKQVQSTWEIRDEAKIAELTHKFKLGDGSEECWASNNLAELKMMYHGLVYIFSLIHRPTKSGRKIEKITVLCDSEFAAGITSGSMKLGKKVDASLYHEAAEIHKMLDEIKRWGCSVEFVYTHNVWVKSILGH